MRIGMEININVDKIDKSRIFKGKKGSYLNLTVFVDTEKKGEYGDNGTVSQSASKDDRAAKKKMPIIGNAKVFFIVESAGEAQKSDEPPVPEPTMGDEVPF